MRQRASYTPAAAAGLLAALQHYPSPGLIVMERLAVATAGSKPGIGTRRKMAFAALLVALVCALVELSAHVGYRTITGEWAFRASSAGLAMEAGPDSGSKAPPKYRYMMLHPFLGFVGDPSQNDKTFLDVHDNRYPMNEYGLVDTHPPIFRRAADKVIVGVVGGSVACFFAQHGVETLRQRLQYDTRFAGKEIVFVNLAVPGHKQPQQLMSLAYILALGGEFDIIINIDGFNEVALYAAENQAAGIHPAFPRMWNHYIAESPDPEVSALKGKIAFFEAQRSRVANALSSSWLGYSALARLTALAIDRRLQAAEYRASLALLARQPKAQHAAAKGPPFAAADENAVYGELVEIWQRCSVQLDGLCRANGIEYFHFLQPNQYVAGSKPLSAEEQRVAVVADHPYRAGVVRGYPLLQDAGRALVDQGVRFSDISDAFATHAEPLYYDACCHFNHTGNEIVAARIADEILAHFTPVEKPSRGTLLNAQQHEPDAIKR